MKQAGKKKQEEDERKQTETINRLARIALKVPKEAQDGTNEVVVGILE